VTPPLFHDSSFSHHPLQSIGTVHLFSCFWINPCFSPWYGPQPLSCHGRQFPPFFGRIFPPLFPDGKKRSLAHSGATRSTSLFFFNQGLHHKPERRLVLFLRWCLSLYFFFSHFNLRISCFYFPISATKESPPPCAMVTSTLFFGCPKFVMTSFSPISAV